MMLHDNMNISRLVVHSKQVEEARAKRKTRDSKRIRYFDGCSSKGRLEINISLDSKRGFLINFLPSSLSLGIRECLTLSLKREELLIYQPRSQPTEGVVRSIMVIALSKKRSAFIVVKLGTWFDIAQM